MSVFGARIWQRLMSNVVEPENEQACWVWKRQLDRHGYGRINIYIPCLKKNAKLNAHIVAFVLFHAGEGVETADDLYWAYKELTLSGLQLDHKCSCRCCINIDHLDVVTPRLNARLRDSRKAARIQNFIYRYE